jgi:hypothetical protein
MGKYTKYVGKILMKVYLAGLTIHKNTVFIDLIDVSCEGVNGFRWLRVDYVMNTTINVNEIKRLLSCFGGGG